MHVCFYKFDADICFHKFTFYHQYHVWAMMLLLKILDIPDGRKVRSFVRLFPLILFTENDCESPDFGSFVTIKVGISVDL